MLNFIKKIFNNIVNDRYERENIQKELYNLLIHDTTITPEQENKLYKVIHCGAYYCLHDAKGFKDYVNEAIIYNNITRTSKDPNILYERFKEVCLSDN